MEFTKWQFRNHQEAKAVSGGWGGSGSPTVHQIWKLDQERLSKNWDVGRKRVLGAN